QYAERNSVKEKFFQAKYLKPILLAITIAVFNQLSGINAILYYAPRVFSMAGFPEDSAFLSSVVIGFVNLVFTMLAMIIIDHFGRKKLMLYGSIGYIVSLVSIAITFFSNGKEFAESGGIVILVSLMLFIASHAFGQGAVIWVFISEIFPNKVRARGQALGSFTHWFMAALISWTFPMFANISGGFIFSFYAFCMVLQLLWVLFKMPETKGIPLEELQKRLHLL
ncbi:MAG: MFS transporter, partial [Bacteroidota bacterium]